MQLLTAQFSPIVNTEPEEHTTEVPKRELLGTIGDSPFGVCKEHIRHPRDAALCCRALSLRAVRSAIPGITMCLSGPWEGCSNWRPKTLTGVWGVFVCMLSTAQNAAQSLQNSRCSPELDAMPRGYNGVGAAAASGDALALHAKELVRRDRRSTSHA